MVISIESPKNSYYCVGDRLILLHLCVADRNTKEHADCLGAGMTCTYDNTYIELYENCILLLHINERAEHRSLIINKKITRNLITVHV